MFLVSGVELVVAACTSGIIGSFPTPNARTVADLDRWMQEIVRRLGEAKAAGRTVAPWAANLMVHSSNTRLEQDLALVVKYQAPIVITALGSPRSVVEAVHAYGGLVYADVITPEFARKAAATGVDGLVLVCTGAGGHFGPLAAPAFIGEVRAFWDGPVMLSGAVGNGRAIRALQVLGADLVYMGTSFVATRESLAVQGYKQMLVEASAKDIFPTNAITGAWANFLRPSMVAAGADPENLKPRGKLDADDPHGEAKPKPWKNIWSAGQAVGQVRAIEHLADIVARLKTEYGAEIRREGTDYWAKRYR
jgi:nitronate monooxygenase